MRRVMVDTHVGRLERKIGNSSMICSPKIGNFSKRTFIATTAGVLM